MRGLVLALALLASPAYADNFQGNYDRAMAAYQQGAYGDAIAYFHRAYEVRPLSRLLVNIGRAHLRLGELARAVVVLRQFLRDDPGASPQLRAEVERDIQGAEAQLQAVVPPPPAYYVPPPAVPPPAVPPQAPQTTQAGLTPWPESQPAPPRSEVRLRRSLLGAGITLLIVSYIPAAAVGGAGGAFRSEFRPGVYPLVVPVAGPFLSAFIMPAASGDASAALYWSLPWALLDGGAQLAGLILTIKGARLRRPPPVIASPWTPPSSGGHGVALSGVF